MGKFYLFATLDDEDFLVVLGVLLLDVGLEHVFLGGFAVVRLVFGARNMAEMAQEKSEKEISLQLCLENPDTSTIEINIKTTETVCLRASRQTCAASHSKVVFYAS